MAALERARAELESVLCADAHWRASRESAGDAGWAGDEKAFAANPVHRCWAQLGEAIEELRRRPQAEAGAGRPRISLRDVLEHIRNDAALLQQPERQAAAPEAERTEPARTAPRPASASGWPAAAPAGTGPAPPEPAPPEGEEATVSFVIREPARAVPVAANGSGASAGKTPTPPERREPAPDPGAEAEVVIVPRRR
jgi:hypothetical protein